MVWQRCATLLIHKCIPTTIGETLRPVQWLGSGLVLAVVIGLGQQAASPALAGAVRH